MSGALVMVGAGLMAFGGVVFYRAGRWSNAARIGAFVILVGFMVAMLALAGGR